MIYEDARATISALVPPRPCRHGVHHWQASGVQVRLERPPASVTYALRIVFVSKRYPQQRDLLTRPYGRFFHLPAALATLGHDVRVLLVGHRRDADADVESQGVQWQARDIRTHGPLRLLRVLDKSTSGWKPDWVVGCSDAWTAWLAGRLATNAGARLAVDAYDDFESYMPWNLPLHAAYRHTLRRADLATAAGPQLARHLDRFRNGRPATHVLAMAADPGFVPLDKAESRRAIGLPLHTPILGYYGGWGSARGTEILIPAFRKLKESSPDALLALTGKPPASVSGEPGVVRVGYLDDSQLPQFVNAVDVACVVTAHSQFGRHSYPAKLCEAMACGTRVVATDTAPVRWMLQGHEASLVPTGDAEEFAEAASRALAAGAVDYGLQPRWPELGARLQDLLANPDTGSSARA